MEPRRNPFRDMNQIDPAQYGEDFAASSQRFRDLYHGQGSKWRTMLDELGAISLRTELAFQRIGEIKVSGGAATPWLVHHHALEGARNIASEIANHLRNTPATLNSVMLDDALVTISRLHESCNDRFLPALTGFAQLGYPEFAAMWTNWQASYCAGIRNAHALTRTLKGRKRLVERLELCIDNLVDHLDPLREMLRSMREVTGPGGWWGATELVELLDEG